MLPLWGTQNNMVRRAQAILNKAGRWTTGLSRRTKTLDLMSANDWLTVREMTSLHSLVIMWKVIHNKRPRTIHRTLQLDDDKKILNREPRLQFTSKTFRHRTTVEWNRLPDYIRNIETIASFKKH